jgi:mannose-6-phosphate isomerase-like protein (cupin superfamily)
VDAEVRLVAEGQSIYIPLGARHRMENPGKLPMILVEVQTGSYLGEDDIVRYEDIYSRK